jgi:hypothetical protein
MSAQLKAVPLVEVEIVAPTDPAVSPADQAEADAVELQAMSEGVVITGETVECMGERYLIGSKVGLMPLMRFAHSSKAGVDSSDMEGLAAMYDMLRDCIAKSDWERFERDMTDKQADDEDLMPVVGKVIEALTARPTKRASASSSGPPQTSGSSTAGSSTLPATVRRPAGADDMVPVNDLGRVLAASGS